MVDLLKLPAIDRRHPNNMQPVTRWVFFTKASGPNGDKTFKKKYHMPPCPMSRPINVEEVECDMLGNITMPAWWMVMGGGLPQTEVKSLVAQANENSDRENPNRVRAIAGFCFNAKAASFGLHGARWGALPVACAR